MLNALNRICRDPRYQVAAMLYCAVMALIDATLGQVLWAVAMIACSAYAMFRVWGGLRAQPQEKDQP